jgi:hypothetical protein
VGFSQRHDRAHRSPFAMNRPVAQNWSPTHNGPFRVGEGVKVAGEAAFDLRLTRTAANSQTGCSRWPSTFNRTYSARVAGATDVPVLG